jgi:hypothetical protein
MSISAKSVRFDDASMWVELSDGRTIGVPFAWFPASFTQRLSSASASRSPHGAALGRVDEDANIAGLLAGRGDRTCWGRRERKRAEATASEASGAGRRRAWRLSDLGI